MKVLLTITKSKRGFHCKICWFEIIWILYLMRTWCTVVWEQCTLNYKQQFAQTKVAQLILNLLRVVTHNRLLNRYTIADVNTILVRAAMKYGDARSPWTITVSVWCPCCYNWYSNQRRSLYFNFYCVQYNAGENFRYDIHYFPKTNPGEELRSTKFFFLKTLVRISRYLILIDLKRQSSMRLTNLSAIIHQTIEY